MYKVLYYTTQLLHEIQTLSPIYSWYLRNRISMPCLKASRSLYRGCTQQLLTHLLALHMQGVYDMCVRIVYSLRKALEIPSRFITSGIQGRIQKQLQTFHFQCLDCLGFYSTLILVVKTDIMYV